MNDLIKLLLTRRSIRAFENKPIPPEELELIVKAGLYAPSGRGLQTWQFTVVTDREKIQKLAALIGKEMGREGYDMYQPETIIIPSNEKDSRFGVEDNACALENIFLAAHSFGIGSVWINQLRDTVDSPAIRQLLDTWGIPQNHTIYGIAALGYAAPAPEREINKTGKVVYVK